MDKSIEIRKYRKETTEYLIKSYRDLIKKTFEIIDKDLLQTKIDGEDEKDTEQRFLDAIKKRRLALDEVDLMLDKIEKLERTLDDEGEEGKATASTSGNLAKKFAKKPHEA